jgi:alpha-tubulin suppressor-like RCC1 family protein
VRCWGAFAHGQLGQGEPRWTFDASRPVVGIGDVGAVLELAAGAEYGCVRGDAGEVRCWGGLSGLGVATDAQDDALAPQSVTELAGAAQLAAGARHLCARMADGTVRCVGSNALGQRGDGRELQSSATPVALAYHAGFLQVAVGFAHRCAVNADRDAVCWGENVFGQLGTNRHVASDVPLVVPGLAPVAGVVAGPEFSCALQQGTGRVFCWGALFDHAVGVGPAMGEGVVQIAGLPRAAVSLAAGGAHACAVLDDASAWCWGANTSGQLGNGLISGPMTDVTLQPVRVPVAGVTQIAAGSE